MDPMAGTDFKRRKRKDFSGFGNIFNIPEIKAAMIVTIQGIPIASALPKGMDETRIAAITAALWSLSERAVIDMEKGNFQQLYVKGNNGYFLVIPAGSDAVLSVSITKTVRLGLIFLECRRAADKIAKIISKSNDFDDFDDDGGYPFPFIEKPPSPPGDLAGAGQLQAQEAATMQVHGYESYCKHCGAKLPKGQAICHVCGKKVI
jgi:predicted regulator of Ras-like GTPase activity (Roadblock/LC7/MglB family)